jgi:magnesium chelatase family protein
LRRWCTLGSEAAALLRHAAARGTLSARAIDRITRVARTIADLASANAIGADHIAEAILYRSLERKGLAA